MSERGVTQGGPVSPKIFNIMHEILGDEAAAEGYGDAIKLFLAIFYTDNGYIASRD